MIRFDDGAGDRLRGLSGILRRRWKRSQNQRGRTLVALCISCAAGIPFIYFAVSAARSDEPRIDQISILDRGVFQAADRNRPIAKSSSLGAVSDVQGFVLVKSTTTIFARETLRFGVRYLIQGAPVGVPVDIRIVTRFPEAGLLDPASGVRHHNNEYVIRGRIGVPAYRGFMFDQTWEMVPGEWVFEFWHAGRNIGSQRFCVVGSENALTQLMQTSCSALLGRTEPRPAGRES